MITRLHKCARTTPRVRAEIAAGSDSIATLAQRYGISPMTVLKWEHRTNFEDRSHTPHRLRTTLTPAQEVLVVELHKTLAALARLFAGRRAGVHQPGRVALGAGSLPAPPRGG